ncbi:hypothetical protein E2C01_019839 [Portunus trituberculatus]|uniref:Uncharacterized protein n=1 Tax=Portunus trituberculatus TaxID=210409 RepID=A0A5B7DYC1_PORTR|nr:hypothetical protein [Portunus trituberculatus]
MWLMGVWGVGADPPSYHVEFLPTGDAVGRSKVVVHRGLEVAEGEARLGHLGLLAGLAASVLGGGGEATIQGIVHTVLDAVCAVEPDAVGTIEAGGGVVVVVVQEGHQLALLTLLPHFPPLHLAVLADADVALVQLSLEWTHHRHAVAQRVQVQEWVVLTLKVGGRRNERVQRAMGGGLVPAGVPGSEAGRGGDVQPRLGDGMHVVPLRRREEARREAHGGWRAWGTLERRTEGSKYSGAMDRGIITLWKKGQQMSRKSSEMRLGWFLGGRPLFLLTGAWESVVLLAFTDPTSSIIFLA